MGNNVTALCIISYIMLYVPVLSVRIFENSDARRQPRRVQDTPNGFLLRVNNNTTVMNAVRDNNITVNIVSSTVFLALRRAEAKRCFLPYRRDTIL